MSETKNKGDKVNVGGNKDDCFYRYKRDRIKIKYINKKGGLTQILNMDKVCSDMKVPDRFVNAFYKKVKKQGYAMIKPGVFRGTVNKEVFEKVLEDMINKYVLCKGCKLPEKNWEKKVCQSCGNKWE